MQGLPVVMKGGGQDDGVTFKCNRGIALHKRKLNDVRGEDANLILI